MGTNNEKHKLIFAQIKNAIQINQTGRLRELVTNNNIMGWTPLHFAIEYQNQSLTKLLLEEENENVDAHDNFNRTPLSIASYKNDLQLMKLLVENGADVKTGFQLHNAVEKGDCNCVNYLIELGVEVNEKNTLGDYPIIIAVRNNNLDATKILVDNGALVNGCSRHKCTPLHIACENNNYQIATLLIESGASIDTLDKHRRTPLHLTLLVNGKPEMTRLLLENGAKADYVYEGESYLHYIMGHPEAALDLIKYGARLDTVDKEGHSVLYNSIYQLNFELATAILPHTDPNDQKSYGGWAPLHAAVLYGNIDLVKELMKFKADVNISSACYVIPLHIAAIKGFVEIADVLLEHGSLIDVPATLLYFYRSNLPYFLDDEEVRLREGDTPLSLATRMGHTEMCDLLLKHRAERMENKISDWPRDSAIEVIRASRLEDIQNITAEDLFKSHDLMGWTCLHHSVAMGNYETCEILIAKGVNINAQDKFERTPLNIAAFKNDVKLLKLLLNAGANVNLGYPLHYAAHGKSFECISELARNDCNMNEWDYPPLILAAERLTGDVVKCLLENGADVNCTNKTCCNETPLIYSCRNQDFDSASILIKFGADVNITDSAKDTPILSASKNKELLSLLLQNNVDLTVQDRDLMTPLYYASDIYEKDDPFCALTLIEIAPEQVDIQDDTGESPLFVTENSIIAEKLVEAGADVNGSAIGGYTILHNTCEGENLKKLQVLLKNNANVNAPTSDNLLPIHIAALEGCVEEVKQLLQHGSYVDAPMYDLNAIFEEHSSISRYREKISVGNTPLICAASKGHVDVVKLLVSSGACLDDVNFNGNTALHEAVIAQSEEVVRVLVESNIEVHAKNKVGKTAYCIAKEMKSKKILSLLLSNLNI